MSAANERLPLRKQWTQDEVSELLATGVLAGQRFELIQGDLIDKMGQDPRMRQLFAACNACLSAYFLV